MKYVFKAVYNNSQELYSILEPITQLISYNVNIKIRESGISIQEIDLDHEVSVDIFLDSKEFIQYSLTGEYDFGIDINDLCDILKMSDNKVEFLILKNKLRVKIYKGNREINYIFKHKEYNNDNINPPDINYNVSINMSIEELNYIISEMLVGCRHTSNIVFDISNKSICIRSDSKYKQRRNFLYDKKNVKLYPIEESFVMSYNIQLLSCLVSNIKKLNSGIYENVSLYISDKTPLKLEFANNRNIKLEYHIF